MLGRNYFLYHVIEEKTEGRREVTGKPGGGLTQLLDDLKEERGY